MAQDQVDQTDLEPQIADTPQDAAQLSDAASQELSMEEALEAVRAERDDMRDRFMRVLADAENSRKRSERDRREAEQYGGSKLARDLLPVYDNLQRALAAVTDEQRAAVRAHLAPLPETWRPNPLCCYTNDGTRLNEVSRVVIAPPKASSAKPSILQSPPSRPMRKQA